MAEAQWDRPTLMKQNGIRGYKASVRKYRIV